MATPVPALKRLLMGREARLADPELVKLCGEITTPSARRSVQMEATASSACVDRNGFRGP